MAPAWLTSVSPPQPSRATSECPQVRRQHFEAIWDRALQSGLRKFIGRQDKSGVSSEEAVEAVVAAVSGDPEGLSAEAADVLYHLLVLLAASGVSPDAVAAHLEAREGVSGLEEKAARTPGSS